MPLKYTGSNQRIPEYHTWTALCVGLGAKSYVELGCGSAHAQRDAGINNIVTIDVLPNGLGGIQHVQGDSHDPEVLITAIDRIGCWPDIVFIDADHSHDGVKKDFDLWWPYVELAVGFHDILMEGVREFWEEVSLQYPSIQIIGRDIASAEAWQHGGHNRGQVNCGGIGVIFK